MPKALVLYHYFHPDDVVSAQHYAELCLGLKQRGWVVKVLPCNRGCRDETRRYPARETWNGIEIRRIWRPPFRQATETGRMLNSLWMLAAWSLAALHQRPDAVILGTDPSFAVLAAIPWRLLRPRVFLFHWCFDLHPEAAIAGGALTAGSPAVRAIRRLLRAAYRRCDQVGSIGECMSRRLRLYDDALPIQIHPPWALLEPPSALPADGEGRRKLFGDAPLALMYSGSFGRAHASEEVLALARELRARGAVLAFGVRGNRARELKEAVTAEDANVVFLSFAPRDRLEERLGAADIQVVTLREEFAGAVVPSKFQGAIAAGRPVLFAGPPDSAVGRWIRQLGLGWVLTKSNVREIADELLRWSSDAGRRQSLNERCFRAYREHFSREATLDGIDAVLRENLPVQLRSAGYPGLASRAER
jgi:colanic acid biosynthesis glycosyl transferase WcaI